MQNPILIKSFRGTTQVAIRRCVVMDASNASNVKLPAAARAAAFVGVTQETFSDDGESNYYGAVMTDGIAIVETDGSGTITAGDKLEIADANGRVKARTISVNATFGSNANRELIGIALDSVAATSGLQFRMKIQPEIYFGE